MDVSTIDAAAADLEVLAARVTAAASDVRSQVGVVAGSAGVDWVGPASRSFRDDLAGQADRVRACAGALDDLSDALRRHAATVRARAAPAQTLVAVAELVAF